MEDKAVFLIFLDNWKMIGEEIILDESDFLTYFILHTRWASAPQAPGANINGKAKAAKSTGSELDAMWGNLSEDIKARILTLAGAAAK